MTLKQNTVKCFNYIGSYSLPIGIGASAIMVLDTYVGTTSISDAISAGANIAMAVIAYKAFKVGRNYVGQMTEQEGYKKALNFKNEMLPKLTKMLFFEHHILVISSNLDSIHTQINAESRIRSIAKQIGGLSEVKVRLSKLYIELRRELNNIASYGLVPINNKKPFIENLIENINNLKDEIQELTTYCDLLIRPYYKERVVSPDGEIIFNIDRVFIREDDPTVLYIRESITQIRSVLVELRRNYSNYREGNKFHIENYFVPE